MAACSSLRHASGVCKKPGTHTGRGFDLNNHGKVNGASPVETAGWRSHLSGLERRVKSVLSRLRRLGASLMLVAVATFVLHGARPAGMHVHAQVAGSAAEHHHGDGVMHVHSFQPGDPAFGAQLDDASSDDSQGVDGRGKACAVVLIAPPPPSALPYRPVAALLFTPASETGAGIDQSGLRRPPRTPCIA